MGWGQLLGGLAGIALAPVTGGASLVASGLLGSTLGGAAEEALGGGATGAAKDAANAANAGAQSSIDLQRRMYEEGVARQQPFYQAGVNALPGYLQGIGPNGELVRGFTQADYQADPGYQFRLNEGLKQLGHAAGARGGLVSGQTLKGLQDYAQNAASAEYSNAYNRYRDTQGLRRNALAGVVGFAPTAAGSMTSSGQNYATSAGPQMYQQGVNTGNALIAGNQANQSAYGNLGNALSKYLGGGGFGGSSIGYGSGYAGEGPIGYNP